jgi:hypothetical protein
VLVGKTVKVLARGHKLEDRPLDRSNKPTMYIMSTVIGARYQLAARALPPAAGCHPLLLKLENERLNGSNASDLAFQPTSRRHSSSPSMFTTPNSGIQRLRLAFRARETAFETSGGLVKAPFPAGNELFQ